MKMKKKKKLPLSFHLQLKPHPIMQRLSPVDSDWKTAAAS